MAPSRRDRISVDLRGMRAALFQQACARGMTPSDLVRDVLAKTVDAAAVSTSTPPCTVAIAPSDRRVRLSLRVTADESHVITSAASAAGLAVGGFVAGLASGVPVLSSGNGRASHVEALVQSNAELATLSRNIHHLSVLLRQAASQAAQEYRGMLDTLNADLRRHLTLAGAVLADLRPRVSGRPTNNGPLNSIRSEP